MSEVRALGVLFVWHRDRPKNQKLTHRFLHYQLLRGHPNHLPLSDLPRRLAGQILSNPLLKPVAANHR